MPSFRSDALQILSERGFLYQHTDLDGLDQALAAGPITAYIGYDPTATSLHIGHLITIMMLYWLQQTGHKVMTLMGGATALVGDPSFKDASRPLLSHDTVQTNIDGIQTIFGKILRYGPAGARMVNNADWLNKINYIDFLREYGPHFSVNRMLSYDSVKMRLEREQHLSFLEFNYSLLQAYDFLHLYREHGVTLQMSGSDQWSNILGGVELARRKENVTLYGLTTPLLTDANGKKMGKSEGNALWLNPELQSDFDMYQYWRNVDDALVAKMLLLFTTLSLDEAKRLGALQGAEINEAKTVLAFEATKLIRSFDAATAAQQTAQQTFGGLGKSDGLPRFDVSVAELQTLTAADYLVRAGLCASKGEAKRLIVGQGARLNDKIITGEADLLRLPDFGADGTAKLSAGKKRHALIGLLDH